MLDKKSSARSSRYYEIIDEDENYSSDFNQATIKTKTELNTLNKDEQQAPADEENLSSDQYTLPMSSSMVQSSYRKSVGNRG